MSLRTLAPTFLTGGQARNGGGEKVLTVAGVWPLDLPDRDDAGRMDIQRQLDLAVVGLGRSFACDLRSAGLSGRREFVIHRLADVAAPWRVCQHFHLSISVHSMTNLKLMVCGVIIFTASLQQTVRAAVVILNDAFNDPSNDLASISMEQN